MKTNKPLQERKETASNLSWKITAKKSFFLRGKQGTKNRNVIVAGGHEQTRYSGTGQRDTWSIRHIRVIGNRWKQSGIRGDITPVTQRKDKRPETRGDLLFKIKHESHETKTPWQDDPSPRCDIFIQNVNFINQEDKNKELKWWLKLIIIKQC